MDDNKTVSEFYDGYVTAEWERLERHPIEFEITKRFVDRYAVKGARVLDCGGGPGRYSLHLAEKGCDVTLIDLSRGNIAFAEEKRKEAKLDFKTLVGDAREADKIASGKFDVVLLMGPLYHLLTDEDRRAAVNACLKLLKTGGVIFASFISSYAGVIYSMKYEPDMINEVRVAKDFRLFEQDKEFAGDAFTKAYFARIRDIAPFFESFGLEKLHLFSQEGMLAPNEPTILQSSPETVKKWIDLAESVCEREDLLAFAEHIMYVGRKNNE